LRGAFGWDGGAVGTGEHQVLVLGVGGPDGTGGDPLFELSSSLVVEDGDGEAPRVVCRSYVGCGSGVRVV
jgi:hypothetical protein